MIKKPPVVYISYCRSSKEDTEWVKQLAERLRNSGIRTLLDVWELRPGMKVDEWYSTAVLSSDFAVMIGSKALSAQWRDEIAPVDLKSLQDFFARDMCFIPVLFPGIASRDLPPPFNNRVGVRMDPEKSHIGYRQLLEALKGSNAGTAPAVREKDPSDRDPSQAVVLNRLTLLNFRRADNLELIRSETALSPGNETGQWTLLLGDNGTGKSSVLWAIGMGLLDRDLVHAILASISSPFIQFGESECSVHVTETSTQYYVKLANEQGRELIIDSSGSPDFMIFGYGTSRGSAFGGPQRAVELDRPLNAINTLYGIPTNLIHAETWIEGLERNALKAGEATEPEQLFHNVCSVLTSVLPGIEEIVVDEDRIRFIGPSVGDCTIDSLSDGYATTLGWIVDMMARWIHEQQRLGRAIPPDFNLNMTGLVLIDELDLHLHPRWQMRIIDDVRRAFPKMSFVATTHNPLTLLGARSGEIYVLDGAGERLNVRQVDLPPGIRADQILTGIWFGLSSTLDIETQHMLDEHREMLRAGKPKEDPLRIELERRLRTRLGSFADTTADRVAQEIVTRELEKDASPLTQFELETVREKVQKALAQKS